MKHGFSNEIEEALRELERDARSDLHAPGYLRYVRAWLSGIPADDQLACVRAARNSFLHLRSSAKFISALASEAKARERLRTLCELLEEPDLSFATREELYKKALEFDAISKSAKQRASELSAAVELDPADRVWMVKYGEPMSQLFQGAKEQIAKLREMSPLPENLASNEDAFATSIGRWLTTIPEDRRAAASAAAEGRIELRDDLNREIPFEAMTRCLLHCAQLESAIKQASRSTTVKPVEQGRLRRLMEQTLHEVERWARRMSATDAALAQEWAELCIRFGPPPEADPEDPNDVVVPPAESP